MPYCLLEKMRPGYARKQNVGWAFKKKKERVKNKKALRRWQAKSSIAAINFCESGKNRIFE